MVQECNLVPAPLNIWIGVCEGERLVLPEHGLYMLIEARK